VHLPKEAARLREYLPEPTAFPKGKHDDQVDSTAQMLDWLKRAGREPDGIYQYYKELAQRAHDPQTARPTQHRRCCPLSIGSDQSPATA
jgi:hypothetical protein